MKVLTLVLQGLVLQGLVLSPLAQYISSRNTLTEKAIKAMQDLATILGDVKDALAASANANTSPTPDPESEVAQNAANLTEVLQELVEAVQNNTHALLEAHKTDDHSENGEDGAEMCEPPFSLHGSECFYVNKYMRVSWSEARKFCQSLQADLAQPTSVSKLRAMLLDKFPEDEYRFFWLGASETATEGRWAWLSKTPLSQREWSMGQPDGGNENCVVLSRDEYPALHDSPCYTHTTFICEKTMETQPAEVPATAGDV